jgi:hypothetical protein
VDVCGRPAGLKLLLHGRCVRPRRYKPSVIRAVWVDACGRPGGQKHLAGRIWVQVCGRAVVLNYSCLGKMGFLLAVHRQDFERPVAKNAGVIL